MNQEIKYSNDRKKKLVRDLEQQRENRTHQKAGQNAFRNLTLSLDGLDSLDIFSVDRRKRQ